MITEDMQGRSAGRVPARPAAATFPRAELAGELLSPRIPTQGRFARQSFGEGRYLPGPGGGRLNCDDRRVHDAPIAGL